MPRSILLCLTPETHAEHAFQWALQNLIQETDRVCLLTAIEPKQREILASMDDMSNRMLPSQQSGVLDSGAQKAAAQAQLMQACKAWLATKEAQVLQRFPLLVIDTLVVCDDCVLHGAGNDGARCQDTVSISASEVREQIVETALKLKPDLMVMGSKAQGKLKRALLGSVSDFCVHHCSCPVLIVK